MKSKWTAIVFGLVFCLLLAACAGQSPANDNQGAADSGSVTRTDSKKHVFGASFMTMNNPHFIDWSEGLKSVIEKKGDKLIVADAQLNISKQIADVEDLVQQKVDVIFIAPADSKGIKPALEAAKRANIPVIIMDIAAEDEGLVTATVSTDNYQAGKLLGEAMVNVMGAKANVGIIDYSVLQAAVDRTDGFADAIKKAPGIKVVARQDGQASTESALPIMENFLQSNPEINAVFAINDPTAMGALSAIEAAQRTDIKIFSIDGSQDAIKLIKEGRIVGTSAQFPVKMGTIAAETAYKVIAGESVEKTIKVSSEWIDKSNYEKYLK